MANTNSSSPSRNGTSRPGEDARLKELVSAVRRNWPLAVGIPVLVLLATGVFLWLVTPIYRQSTSIRIEDEKPSIPLLEVEMLPQLSGGSAVETEMLVLGSRVIAEEVVDSLGLQLVLEKPRRTLRSEILARVDVGRDTPAGDYVLERQSDGRYRMTVRYEPEQRRGEGGLFSPKVTEVLGSFGVGGLIPIRGGVIELAPGAAEYEEIVFGVEKFYDAVDDLRETVQITRPTRDADLVVASHEGPDPLLVRDVTNALAWTFITRRQEVSKAEARSSVTFLEDQIRSLGLQLAGAEDELRDFREEYRVIAPEAEASAQIERLAKLQAERDAIAAEAVALRELLRDIERETPETGADSSAYRRLIAFPTLFRNPAASELLAQLAEVENERAKLLNRRTMDDVDVRVLTTRVGEIERQLRTLAMTYLQGLGEQVQSLSSTLAGYGQGLEAIPDREIAYGRLLRQASVLNDIYLTLQSRLKEAELSLAVEDESVRVVDPAIYLDEPVRPNVPVSLGFALLLGTMLGLGAAIGRELMDTKVRTRDDLQETLGLTVLGSIPRIHDPAAETRSRRFGGRTADRGTSFEPRLVTMQDPRSPVAEAYRALRTNITFSAPDRRPKTLVFTSAMPGDGKSTTASNLAITLAQQDVRLLLIDTDMRRGTLHEQFTMEREPGLSDVVRGRTPFEQARQTVTLDQGPAFDFLATGSLPPNPAELLGSERLKALLEGWKERYEMVIMDAPPLNVVTDAAILGTQSDGVVLVARSGVTDRAAISFALEQLHNVRAPVLGTVLNDVDLRRDTYGGSAAAHAYYYGTGD